MNISKPMIVPVIDRAVPERSLIKATPTAIEIAVTFSASHGMKYRLLLYNIGHLIAKNQFLANFNF